MTVTPCIHPRCDDGNGDAALTTQTMCDPCRSHYRRQLDWLVMDYVTLKVGLPKPSITGDVVRRSNAPAPGHPAEWASDMCHEIANMLNAAENDLRAAQGDNPALYVVPEHVKVRDAQRYLSARWDEFCTFDNADEFADAITETHASVRRRLGLTRFAQKLPMPCPTCDVGALWRSVGQVDCRNCGRVVREQDYPMLTRIAADSALDDLIEQYDTRKGLQELA